MVSTIIQLVCYRRPSFPPTQTAPCIPGRSLLLPGGRSPEPRRPQAELDPVAVRFRTTSIPTGWSSQMFVESEPKSVLASAAGGKTKFNNEKKANKLSKWCG